ncbi:MAG: class I SAM-dependent methyltransferase [Gammaproteobacteria bacterium]|nr:class I SAM-dependent methyltransferase [Gammaproteobacteria bacterium]
MKFDMTSKLREIYDSVPYLSIKYDSYFPAYEALLRKYVDREVTIVEVGIFNGGSLFMWRKFFGPKARIIGVDLNPDAREWEKHGFEIYIGDQSSDTFWTELFQKIGKVDVVIDDGGHTNRQQIVTSHYAIQNINDGGLLIVEDVHTNYFREFGNPSRYSFVNFAHRIVDGVNSRAYSLRRTYKQYSSRVYSVSFFESMVAFQIDAQMCKQSVPTSNNGASRGVTDFRYQGPITSALFAFKNKFTSNGSLAARVVKRGVDMLLSLLSKAETIRYRKYFKDMS